ncbi:MerR family transcriptional regulator [Streptomyces sp. GXMU-J5]|uniref:MerR family transcriptional regulator n=1 Tax=Streptomyces beihaiensis TaxID=2984495 RepID=A0ABT3TX83_9ACTN|nr:MerR family transcriptional regulator [Streptomyces beihaiensis]MCX3061654.1 MerR family transcriptional regulator [Streptomyces beihaiensis]
MVPDDASWSIGELAERAATTVKTVRFYSDSGLLPQRPRSGGGHRRYGPEALERLRLIRALRGLGLALPEVCRALDELDEGGGEAGAGGAFEGAVASRLRSVGSQLAALRWQEAALRLVQECPPGERAERLRLVGAMSSPPSTGTLVRFWRAWLPARMPAKATSAFLDAAVPEVPQSPGPLNVLAFARLHAMVSRPCTPDVRPAQPAAHQDAGPRDVAVLYGGLASAYELAGAELRAGRAPGGGEALDGFVDAYACARGRHDTPDFRRRLARQLADDPRIDAYWELVEQVVTPAGQRPEPTPGSAHDWLLKALHTDVADYAA